MSVERVSAPTSAPEQLLFEMQTLHSALHAGGAMPPLPPAQQGEQDSVFLLDHVAQVSERLLKSLNIAVPAPPKQHVPQSTMHRIRANVDVLSKELVGLDISSDLHQVTLQDLIASVQNLNDSVRVTSSSSACSIV